MAPWHVTILPLGSVPMDIRAEPFGITSDGRIAWKYPAASEAGYRTSADGTEIKDVDGLRINLEGIKETPKVIAESVEVSDVAE